MTQAPNASKSLTIRIGLPVQQFDVALGQDVPHAGFIQVGKYRLKLDSPGPNSAKKNTSQWVGAENFELASGVNIAVVHLRGSDGRPYAAVIGLNSQGRPQLLWQAEESQHGDPGERTQQKTRLVDGAEGAALYAGTTYEQARLCGQKVLPLLDPVRIDESGAHPSAPPVSEGAGKITATVTPAAQVAAPALQLLTAQGQSNGDRLVGPALPLPLLDGDVNTSWSSGAQFGGQGQFVSLRLQAHGLPLERMAVRFAPGSAPPNSLHIHTQAGTVDVVVPDTLSDELPWVVVQPAAPITTPCISIEIAASATSGQAVELAEVRAYTEFDQHDGLTALIKALSGPKAAAAGGILAQSGEAALPALAHTWPELDRTARRRALPLLLRHIQRPATFPMLHAVLDDTAVSETPGAPGESLREAAMQWIGAHSALALDLVIARLQANPPDAELALLVANTGPTALAESIANALAAVEAGSAQGQLAQAFAKLARRDPQCLAQLQDFLQLDPPPSAAARLALALSSVGIATEPLLPLVERAIAGNEDFATRYWALQAAPLGYQPLQSTTGHAENHQAGTTALSFVLDAARHDPTWMLRDEALAALQRMDPTLGLQAAQAALDDPYPRVRARAVRLLGPTAGTSARLLRHLNEDQWYLVRIAAAESLGDSPELRAGLRSRVHDPTRDVRVAAIQRLGALRDSTAWPEIEKRMLLRGEALAVKLAAVEYAGELCVAAAAAPLQEFLESGLLPSASEATHELAVAAAGALARLGRAASVTPVLERSPDLGLKSAMQQALHQSPACTP